MDPAAVAAASSVDVLTQFQVLFGTRAAYPLIATILTLVIAGAKKSPYTKVWYAKIPDGWRWLVPVVFGGIMGFVKAYESGYAWTGALAETLGGIFGVSFISMGLNAALKESPLPWGGEAGGKPAPEPAICTLCRDLGAAHSLPHNGAPMVIKLKPLDT